MYVWRKEICCTSMTFLGLELLVEESVSPGLLSWILLKCQFANKFPFVSGGKMEDPKAGQ